MVWSVLQTSEADVAIYVDDDDPTFQYLELPISTRVSVTLEPHIGRAAAAERVIAKHPHYRMYLVMPDDCEFLRPGWDNEVRAAMDAFGDDIGCVHLSSENKNPWVNFACVSRKWIDTVGWYNCPDLSTFCQDTVIQLLAQALGRLAFIEPQVLRHDCINEQDALQKLAKDTDRFLWWCAKDFGDTLKRLQLETRG